MSSGYDVAMRFLDTAWSHVFWIRRGRVSSRYNMAMYLLDTTWLHVFWMAAAFMSSQQLWLLAQDLHTIKPVNVPAWVGKEFLRPCSSQLLFPLSGAWKGRSFPQWCSHWQVAYALGNNPTHAHIGYPNETWGSHTHNKKHKNKTEDR